MNAIALGATLYIPVLRPNLLDICLGGSPDLRSIVCALRIPSAKTSLTPRGCGLRLSC